MARNSRNMLPHGSRDQKSKVMCQQDHISSVLYKENKSMIFWGFCCCWMSHLYRACDCIIPVFRRSFLPVFNSLGISSLCLDKSLHSLPYRTAVLVLRESPFHWDLILTRISIILDLIYNWRSHSRVSRVSSLIFRGNTIQFQKCLTHRTHCLIS